TAERQTGDAGVADDPRRADETVCLRGDVELTEECAAVRPGRPGPWIRHDPPHPGHVDEQAAVRAPEPGRAVAAGPDGDLEVAVAGAGDRRGSAPGGRRAGDDGWPSIVDRVPQAARVVVAGL